MHDATDTLAHLVLAAGDTASRILPLSEEHAGFDLLAGHKVGARVTELREARGEQVVGWKIGFTNKNIWQEFGATAPIWGPMYDTTVFAMGDGMAEFEASGFAEPRIEPEVVLRLGSAPSAAMDEDGLMQCIDGVAHGFEMVSSIFPGWKFKAPDTVAAFGLHGCLCHGPIAEADDRETWMKHLNAFEIVLKRNGDEVDRGVAANVLGGPLSALKHFVAGLDGDPSGRRLKAGDLVTTGTVTGAFPVEPGEQWSTEVSGLPLPGIQMQIV